MAKKNRTIKYLYYGVAIYIAYYLFKSGSSIKGIGARPKKRYFLKIWYTMDDSKAKYEEYPTKKEAKAAQKSADRRGYSNILTQYHSKIIELNAEDATPNLLARWKVNAMSSGELIYYYKNIFNYPYQQENDPIWHNLDMVKDKLINYYTFNQ